MNPVRFAVVVTNDDSGERRRLAYEGRDASWRSESAARAVAARLNRLASDSLVAWTYSVAEASA